MANWKTITRRSFLVLGAAFAGGAAFGAYKVGEVPANPLVPAPGATPLNPWVVITDAGVTVIAPRAEMGQGISTTLAALVAEELDVAWEQVRVLHGPPAQAYFNAGFVERMSNLPDYLSSMEPRSHNAILAAVPRSSLCNSLAAPPARSGGSSRCASPGPGRARRSRRPPRGGSASRPRRCGPRTARSSARRPSPMPNWPPRPWPSCPPTFRCAIRRPGATSARRCPASTWRPRRRGPRPSASTSACRA